MQIQWVIGHLEDTDFVAFLLRCKEALKPGGFLGLKENNVAEKEVINIDEQVRLSNNFMEIVYS